MTDAHPAPRSAQRQNRNVLIVIALLIFGSFAIAGVLRFSGWQPAGMKNKGQMLTPPGDLRQLEPRLADGRMYRWQPALRHWRILVAAPQDCGAPCRQLAQDLHKIWQLSGRDAERLHVLWLGPPPQDAPARQHLLAEDAALRAALPGQRDANGPVTYIVDPNGFAILRYLPGHDPGDLRHDLVKLLKLR